MNEIEIDEGFEVEASPTFFGSGGGGGLVEEDEDDIEQLPQQDDESTMNDESTTAASSYISRGYSYVASNTKWVIIAMASFAVFFGIGIGLGYGPIGNSIYGNDDASSVSSVMAVDFAASDHGDKSDGGAKSGKSKSDKSSGTKAGKATLVPTQSPSSSPTRAPTMEPSSSPSSSPTGSPTGSPTMEVVYYSDRAAFDAATGGGLSFESFEQSFDQGSPQVFTDFTASETNGVNVLYQLRDQGEVGVSNAITDGTGALVHTDNACGSVATFFDFSTPINAFGIDVTTDRASTITVGGDSIVDSFTTAVNTPQFWGVIARNGITQVTFESSTSFAYVAFDSASYGEL